MNWWVNPLNETEPDFPQKGSNPVLLSLGTPAAVFPLYTGSTSELKQQLGIPLFSLYLKDSSILLLPLSLSCKPADESSQLEQRKTVLISNKPLREANLLLNKTAS